MPETIHKLTAFMPVDANTETSMILCSQSLEAIKVSEDWEDVTCSHCHAFMCYEEKISKMHRLMAFKMKRLLEDIEDYD